MKDDHWCVNNVESDDILKEMMEHDDDGYWIFDEDDARLLKIMGNYKETRGWRLHPFLEERRIPVIDDGTSLYNQSGSAKVC